MFQCFSISRGLRNCRLNVHLRSYLFLPFVARERKRNKIKNQFTSPSSSRNIMFTAVLSRYHYQGPWYSIVWTSYVLSVFHRCAVLLHRVRTTSPQWSTRNYPMDEVMNRPKVHINRAGCFLGTRPQFTFFFILLFATFTDRDQSYMLYIA